MFESPKIEKVSIVIPVFNEQDSLPELIRRTDAACALLNRDYEILLVDDGSSDESARMLCDAAEAPGSHVVAVLLNRNYGQNRDKGTALMAVQHCFHNMAAVGAQHTAVVAHRFTGGALNQAVDHLRRRFAKHAVLTVLAHGADHVVTFIGFFHQAGDLFRRVL